MNSKYFLLTGNLPDNYKNFSILLSKQFTKEKNNSLIINFNDELDFFFKGTNTIKKFTPQKFSLKEFYLNVDHKIFLHKSENKNFINDSIKEFSKKYSIIIFIINKSDHWIYHLLNDIENLVKLEFTKISDIENSIEMDINNKTKISNFLISASEIKYSKKTYINLKKIYLNKIILFNFDFKEDIENILLIPKNFYDKNSLKLIKSILNDI